MTKPLAGVSILLVEDDPDAGELLSMALESRGAHCRLAESGAAAVRELSSAPADVILCDLGLPDGSGLVWLPKLRELPGMGSIPAVAISGHASHADRATSLAAGFAKHLVKPAALADIVTAITILTSHNGPFALQPMLANLAKVTGCRYSSFLRFEGDTLVSVWTYDRANEVADAFPLLTGIETSYCILVKQAGEVVVIENAADDPRAVGHPKQHALATYAGAPVFGADGVMLGTLCTYDEAPRTIGAEAKSALSDAARQLEDEIRQAAS
ncbi:N/A [soil metagenome]